MFVGYLLLIVEKNHSTPIQSSIAWRTSSGRSVSGQWLASIGTTSTRGKRAISCLLISASAKVIPVDSNTRTGQRNLCQIGERADGLDQLPEIVGRRHVPQDEPQRAVFLGDLVL